MSRILKIAGIGCGGLIAVLVMLLSCASQQEEEASEPSEEETTIEETTVETATKETTTERTTSRLAQSPPIATPVSPEPVQSSPEVAAAGPCGISTDWQQGQLEWMNSTEEQKAAIRECHIAQREAGTGPIVTHESAQEDAPQINTRPAGMSDEEAQAAVREHARQSQAANLGQGEGANMCGIHPDATWYGQPC